MPFAFESALVCLLAFIAFPFVFLGVASSDLGQRCQERSALLAAAGMAACLAGGWFSVMMV